MARRFIVPGWFWKLERKLNIGGEARLAKHMDVAVSWLTEVANKSLATVRPARPGEEEVKSIVELFAEQSSDDAEGLRPEDLVDFIQVMIISARDTTATALTWLFYELSKNPHVEARIREEIVTKFPDRANKSTSYFTPEDAKSLVYMEACIKEALRLHPPPSFIFKEASEDGVIGNDVLVRKGELVGLSLFVAAQNPHVWGEDAAQFNPNRWIDDKTGELRQFPSSKFSTFGCGPRSCMGMKLAMLELRVVVANLLSRFRFHLDEAIDDSYDIAVLLVMKNPIIAHVSPVHLPGAAA